MRGPPITRGRATGAAPVSVPARRRLRPGRAPAAARSAPHARGLQVTLGLLWLLDGALQFQPFMLGTGFGEQVISHAATAQPAFVAVPVHWAARVIVAHPVAWDVPFALIQLLLGLGMLYPRTVKAALAASLPWVLGVWYLGEGLGGIASGNASLLTGAPGAVLLYGVLRSPPGRGTTGGRTSSQPAGPPWPGYGAAGRMSYPPAGSPSRGRRCGQAARSCRGCRSATAAPRPGARSGAAPAPCRAGSAISIPPSAPGSPTTATWLRPDRRRGAHRPRCAGP